MAILWLNPVAAVALLALIAPVLIHLLADRRPPSLPFPTLRFIQPAWRRSIKRRRLEDLALLVVRSAVLAAAAVAIAGPFLVTAARRRSWEAQTFRAVVDNVDVVDLRGGLDQARARLDRQPPGRREIVIRSPFPLGSIDILDVNRVPRDIGLRFERTSTLPPTRTVQTTPVLAAAGADGGRPAEIQREARLDGDRSSVRDVGLPSAGRFPVDVVASPEDQRAVADVIAALLGERVPAAPPNRAAVIILSASEKQTPANDIRPTQGAWMADATARIWRDLSRRGLMTNRLRFGSSSGRLGVAVDARASDPIFATLMRSVLESLALSADRSRQEILPIPDADLASWSREPGPAAAPRRETITRDDRRWLWALALILLGLESWIRRSGAETSRVA